MKCILQVEKDKTCRSVLERHWPSVDRREDVTDRDTVELIRRLRPGLICGGFPCQDLSVAGKRAGLAGERSGLWYAFRDILAAARPGWVLIENVDGLRSSWSGDSPGSLGISPGPGRTMDLVETSDLSIVLNGLRELGYWWAYRVLDSQWFGVPQQRRRVFIVGHLGGSGDARARRLPAEVLFEPAGVPWDSPPSREAKPDVARCVRGGTESGSNEGNGVIPFDTTQITSPGNYSHLRPGKPCHPLAAAADAPAVAYVANDYTTGGYRSSMQSGPLTTGTDKTRSMPLVVNALDRHMGCGGVDDNAAHAGHIVVMPLKAKANSSHDESHETYIPFVSHTLRSEGHDASEDGTGRGVPIVAWALQERDGKGPDSDTKDGHLIPMGQMVRRLTPIECERLQSFPDDWTRWRADGTEISNSARYRMLGNAVTVNVIRWIGNRLSAITGPQEFVSLFSGIDGFGLGLEHERGAVK